MNRRRKQWKYWLAWFGGIGFLLMGSVIGFVAAVDPYQIYHPVLGGRPRFALPIQRYFVAGLARTSDYELALAGTSFLQNISNSAVERLCGMRAVNLCMAGASIHEEASAIRLALEHKGTRMVIATLDYNSMSGGSLGKVVGSDYAFPEYLYDNSPFARLSYLLSWDSVTAARHALWGAATPEENENTDWPWKFPPTMKFAAASAVRGIDPASINASFHMINLKAADMEQAFAVNIFPLLEKHPDARVRFVFVPYSILAWHDFAQRGQMETYFAFRKWLVAQQQRFGNFDVVDFQGRADIVTDLSHYADIYHFSEPIVEEVVGGACAGAQMMNAKNVDAHADDLRKLVSTTDPAAIIHAASGSGQ
jgi:hypothetical protein